MKPEDVPVYVALLTLATQYVKFMGSLVVIAVAHHKKEQDRKSK